MLDCYRRAALKNKLRELGEKIIIKIIILLFISISLLIFYLVIIVPIEYLSRIGIRNNLSGNPEDVAEKFISGGSDIKFCEEYIDPTINKEISNTLCKWGDSYASPISEYMKSSFSGLIYLIQAEQIGDIYISDKEKISSGKDYAVCRICGTFKPYKHSNAFSRTRYEFDERKRYPFSVKVYLTNSNRKWFITNIEKVPLRDCHNSLLPK